MPVTLVVVLAAVVAAGRRLGAVALAGRARPGRSRGRGAVAGPLARPPPALRRGRPIDRPAVIGGLMLVVALAVVFATALVVGVVFDMVDRDRGLARWDRAVAEWGSRNATAWSTERARHAHRPRRHRATWLVIARGRRRRTTTSATATPTSSLFLLVVLVGVVLVNNGLKLIVDRERPDVTHLVGTSGSSFPSGHSAAAAAAWFALALVVARHWSRRRPGRGRGRRRRDQPSPWPRRARCSACTGSPTSSPAWWSAGAGSCSAPWCSAAASSAWASPASSECRAERPSSRVALQR